MWLDKKKIFIITSIVIGSVILASALITLNLVFTNDREESISYDIPNFIHINNNWTDTASHYFWCKGVGTDVNPYVIENIVVEGNHEIACLFIENSDDFFIIRNCKFQNLIYSGAGIRLSNVSHGKLIENECSDNYGDGIYLYYSDHIEIISNYITLNADCGLNLHGSSYNSIINNTITYNIDGINILFSNYNLIQQNTLTNNITCYFQDDNSIGNNFTDNVC